MRVTSQMSGTHSQTPATSVESQHGLAENPPRAHSTHSNLKTFETEDSVIEGLLSGSINSEPITLHNECIFRDGKSGGLND